jgi:hypothetical protein
VIQESLMPIYVILACLIVSTLVFSPARAGASDPTFKVAADQPDDQGQKGNQHQHGDQTKQGQDGGDQNAKKDDQPKLTPEEKMSRRYPQPVRIGHLVGLPVLDGDDSTIGFVRQVVRSPEGKIFLIVPYSAWFGWLPVEWGKRPVAVPIETVAILARQIDVLDIGRDEIDAAPTWTSAQGKPISNDEKTLIALGRR